MNLWMQIYRKVQKLGMEYQGSLFDVDGYRATVLGSQEQNKILKQISDLQKVSDEYLNKIRMTPKQPLYHYDHKDKTTHASSKSFLHDDKLPDSVVLKYGYDYMSE